MGSRKRTPLEGRAGRLPEARPGGGGAGGGEGTVRMCRRRGEGGRGTVSSGPAHPRAARPARRPGGTGARPRGALRNCFPPRLSESLIDCSERTPQPTASSPQQLAFPLTWPLSSPPCSRPGAFTFQMLDSWVNFCFRPEEGRFAFHNAAQWRRRSFLSSCERGFFK